MNRELGLKILGQIMGWEDAQAQEEFRWLSFMSAYKYDSYREYLAGARFIEALATWLQQFDKSDRVAAYNFIKTQLIYFSPSEIQRLVEKLFPEYIQKDLQKIVCSKLGIPNHMIWSSENSLEEFRWQKRKTLLMGLSDGARIDVLRRANAGIISNEQVAITTEINTEKWKAHVSDLQADLEKIRKSSGKDAKFSSVYLIDDFTASGTSLIREEPIGSGTIKGKLHKFAKSIHDLGGSTPFEKDFNVVVHHYIATEQAKQNIEKKYDLAKDEFKNLGLSNIKFTYGLVLPSRFKLTASSSDPFSELCKKYYDGSIYSDHFKKSGCPDGKFGYAECGLPIVLEHNTPNNSVSLLWAETEGKDGAHAMKPLFRRRQRHTDFTG